MIETDLPARVALLEQMVRDMDRTLARLDARLDRLDARVDASIDKLDARIDRLSSRLDHILHRVAIFVAVSGFAALALVLAIGLRQP